MITGTYPHEVRAAFRALGIDWHRRPVSGKPTLAAWLKGTQADRTEGRVFLVVAGNHWQLITGRRYACGRIGAIVSIRDEKVKRRARVTEVYELVELNNAAAVRRKTIATLAADAAHKTHQRSSDAADQRYVKSVAAQHGFTVEVDHWGGGSKTIYCFCPDWMSDLDPNIETSAYSWSEARDRIDELVELMNEMEQQRAAA